MFPGPLGVSLAGKALASGIWSLDTHDIRDAATDKHRTVDDTPAGGGPGMVMKADVLARALDTVPHDQRPRLLMSPRGTPLTQARVAAAGRRPRRRHRLRPLRGRRRAADRARELEEVSLGDFVLSGGELAAIALLDACVRLLPGVMGKEASIAEESFADGLLEYPQYTRPPVFEGEPIPEVLLSGDHGKVAPGGGPRPNGSPGSAGRTSGRPIWPEKAQKRAQNARVTRRELCRRSSPNPFRPDKTARRLLALPTET